LYSDDDDLTGALNVREFRFAPPPPLIFISCCIKNQNDLPFWHRLTQVVLEYWSLNEDVQFVYFSKLALLYPLLKPQVPALVTIPKVQVKVPVLHVN